MCTYKEAYSICVDKVRANIGKLSNELNEYKATLDGNYFKEGNSIDFLSKWNWMTSFFTGMALLAYSSENDGRFLRWCYKHLDLYKAKVFDLEMETMHDLGFLYSPYSVAIYKLNGDTYNRRIAIKAADELAKRFVFKGNYINAWARMDERDNFTVGLAIIDCMMNLPLLFWAWTETGNDFYRDIAEAHANMTLKYMIRDDFSVYHAYRFDPESGEALHGANHCGFSDESYWARGTTWAIYGFALAYSYTKKDEYLDVAIKIAEKFIDNLPEDYVPIWDFRLPKDTPAVACGVEEYQKWDKTDTENTKYNRDTSATAIACCGFMEILKYRENSRLEEYIDKMLNSLCSDKYFDKDINTPGILKCSNGNMTYTSFGDYYFMEALYMKNGGKLRFW